MRYSFVFCALFCVLLVSIFSSDVLAQKQEQDLGMFRADTFGAGWTGDSLANIEIGRFPGRLVSYRFRANHTGTFQALELYLAFRTLCDGCYANGDGGIIQVQIQTDDGTGNHFPTGVTLGSTIIDNPMTQWNRVVTFSQPIPLVADTLYHIVFTNLSSDPTHNYISIDTLHNNVGGVDPQPSAAPTDLAVLTKIASNYPLALTTYAVPIFSIYFDDGYRQGQVYMDVRQNTVLGSSVADVSEALLVNDMDHLVTSLSVRLSPVAAVGKIRVTITNSSNQTLATATIDLTKATAGVYSWFNIKFPQIQLSKGMNYTIVLSAKNGAQYYFSPMQQGGIYGFQWEKPYTGFCQIMNNTKWTPCLGRTDLDLPFYFR